MQLRYLPIAIIPPLFLLFSSSCAGQKHVGTGPADPEIRKFVRLVNTKRFDIGCPELKWEDGVAAIARDPSRDTVLRHFFSHTNPDGKDPFEWLKESNLIFFKAEGGWA